MATPNSPAQLSLTQLSDALAEAVETGGQAVVAVHGRPQYPSSGILWRGNEEGNVVIVTTDHTLKRHEDISVTLPNGATVPATLAGRDVGTDLAVLRIPPSGALAANLSPEASLKAGNIVLALGRRAQNDVTVSFGILSALGAAWRTWRGGAIDRFIRPDLNIYIGFSGGALVDAEGRVIGLNTSALSRRSAITIPASTVSRTVDDILARGHVRRGFLGVGLHPVELPGGKTGLIIISLEPDGPAARAGVFVGDVLVALEGQPVADTDDVQSHLGGDRVGTPLAADFVRGGSPITLLITPAERASKGAR
jgi:S1-C subfamily serine protease